MLYFWQKFVSCNKSAGNQNFSFCLCLRSVDNCENEFPNLDLFFHL